MNDSTTKRDSRGRFTATKSETKPKKIEKKMKNINKKIEKVEYTIPLNVEGGEMFAIVEITRYGQEEAAVSNKVVVQALLYLPVKKFGIPPEITFGEKAEVFGKRLGRNWGKLVDHDTFRVLSIEFAGISFPALFEEAKEYAFDEIAKINNLLDVRRQAYLDAN